MKLTRYVKVAAVALLALCAASGCGPVIYTSAVNKAEAALIVARENNAHWYAPYEYHYAQANLEKAYEEASHAQYEDAVKLARAALDYASRALRIAEHQRFEDP
jgi:multidrug efflux pump subunit AcrA (membrane-fusion protein)